MMKFVIGYLIFQIVLFLVLLIISNRTDKRNRGKFVHINKVPPGFEKTSESFIDTKSKVPVYVYFHPETGKRLYVIE
ncbi:hypothetical protein KO561_15665 [Radiobacillus kanasensis]|uniref:hypothetical protein n=1 Tax=Radiobacillus kanasensis TaxID=2844358 RepID=UPI001E4C9163|nr:hypothetical protein [Radiobacillus kanasensis]UFT98618.1 hypothetical protein KO561_15665 [Radiobacillus kanasensis]